MSIQTKFVRLSFVSLIAVLAPVASFAGISPIQQSNVAGMNVSQIANDIHAVQQVRVDGYSYKIVSMESSLNGDLDSTVVVLVGEEVGGNAGYEQSFLVGPSIVRGFTSARVVGDRVELTGTMLPERLGNRTISIKYNPATHQLSVR